jgi:hypothetical protein
VAIAKPCFQRERFERPHLSDEGLVSLLAHRLRPWRYWISRATFRAKSLPDLAGTLQRSHPCALALAAVRQPLAAPAAKHATFGIEQLERPPAALRTCEVMANATKGRLTRHKPRYLPRLVPFLAVTLAVADRDGFGLALQRRKGDELAPLIHLPQPRALPWRWHLPKRNLPAILDQGTLALPHALTLCEVAFPLSRACSRAGAPYKRLSSSMARGGKLTPTAPSRSLRL